jgi:hypothetical protein
MKPGGKRVTDNFQLAMNMIIKEKYQCAYPRLSRSISYHLFCENGKKDCIFGVEM